MSQHPNKNKKKKNSCCGNIWEIANVATRIEETKTLCFGLQVTPMKDTKDTQDNGKTVDERYSLSSDLSQLVNNPHLSDVVFVLEEGRVRVFGHKVLLAARSEMFRALLFGGMKESRFVIIHNSHKSKGDHFGG